MPEKMATFLRMPRKLALCVSFLKFTVYMYMLYPEMDGFLSFLRVFPNPLPNKTSRAFHGVNHEDCNPYDGHQFFIFGNGNGITSAQCTASWAPRKNPEGKEEWRNA